jgi:hypothetical protein
MRFPFAGFVGNLKQSSLTGNQAWTLPDRSGEIITNEGPGRIYSPIISVIGSKTMALSDIGTIQDCTNTAAATLTLPLNSTVPFPIGSTFRVNKRTLQNVSIGAVGGVTLLGDLGSVLTTPQLIPYSVTLRKVLTNTWIAEFPPPNGQFTTVSQSNPIVGDVYRATGGSFALSTTPVRIGFDTIDFQSPANFFNLATSRYTVTASEVGMYLANVGIEVFCSAISTISLRMHVNGVFQRTIAKTDAATAGALVYLKGSGRPKLLAGGDYVEFFLLSNVPITATYVAGAGSTFCDLTKIT